jgi:hypothetical protein
MPTAISPEVAHEDDCCCSGKYWEVNKNVVIAVLLTLLSVVLLLAVFMLGRANGIRQERSRLVHRIELSTPTTTIVTTAPTLPPAASTTTSAVTVPPTSVRPVGGPTGGSQPINWAEVCLWASLRDTVLHECQDQSGDHPSIPKTK